MKKRRIARSADPHLEREAARYEHPIASREFILQTLAEAGVPLADEELARRLAIGPAERDAFERRVTAMERDGQVLRNRKGAILVATKLDLVSGRVEGHPDGYGFVIPEDGADLYLDPHEMRKVLHGDRVMVRESGLDRRGRREGKIVEVIERANRSVVGRLHRERQFLFVQPSERRISQSILVAPEDAAGAQPGQVVVAELTAQPDGHTQPIADVSHYVRDRDALDLDARERGNSVYFPRRVIPMLPEPLSNGLCSLKAEVDRLCMVCDAAIGAKGEIGRYRFYPAVMRSRARLTYTAVAAALADPRGEAARRLKGLLPRLQLLDRLFRALLKAREERGAIDFETVETEFVFDDKGRLGRIDRVERNDAHRIIEECMLAANACAAVPTWSCFRPSCCARCSRPSTARKTSATSGSPTSTIRISPRRSGAIPTCSSIARSRRCSRAGATTPGTGSSWACTARRPSAVPTMRRARSPPGSSATTCATASARSSKARYRR